MTTLELMDKHPWIATHDEGDALTLAEYVGEEVHKTELDGELNFVVISTKPESEWIAGMESIMEWEDKMRSIGVNPHTFGN